MIRSIHSITLLFLVMTSSAVRGHLPAPAGPMTALVGGLIPAQSPDPKLPEPPKPHDGSKELPPPPDLVDVDHAVRLLDVLHQKDEFKLRELEESGEVIVYGEDGQPVTVAEARAGRSQVNIKSNRGGRNGRLGVSIFVLLVAGYLLLRGGAGHMAAK